MVWFAARAGDWRRACRELQRLLGTPRLRRHLPFCRLAALGFNFCFRPFSLLLKALRKR
jgi:hypothetical protein